MGLTYVDAELAEPGRPKRRERVRFLVDSGAIYSLAPASILRRLGIRPLRRDEFELDPVRRRLRRTRLLMAGFRRGRRRQAR